MKYSTKARLVGAYNVFVGGFFAYLGYNVYPPLLAIPLCLSVDGISDVITGKHHYLGLKIWQHLTSSERRKREIQESLDLMEKL